MKPLLLLASLLLVTSAAAEDAYFVTLFAYQTPILNRPKDSHTFASFVKRSPRDGAAAYEEFTISWLPRRMASPNEDISFLGSAEPGANYTLERTLEIGGRGQRRPKRWGPFRVTPELYRRALARYRFLESGVVRYIVLDGGTRDLPAPDGAVNCIHAVSDLTGAKLVTGTHRGESATEDVVRHLAGGFVGYPEVHEWLARGLGFSSVAPVETRHVLLAAPADLSAPAATLGRPEPLRPAVTLGAPIPLPAAELRWRPAFDGR